MGIVKAFFIIICALGLVFPLVSAYEVGMHGRLTDRTVEHFNTLERVFVSDAWKTELMRGSHDEDNDMRYLHHFYDPISKKGLTFANDELYIETDAWPSARAWARDEKLQTEAGTNRWYTTLTLLPHGELNTDFTWQRAIELYRAGEHERAMEALGHVLHLIQDMTVPEHTRNDAHPGDSPYELYTADLQVPHYDGLRLVRLNTLDEYFDELARYTNSHFLSKDSIDVYDLPRADYERLEKDGFLYGFNHDDQGEYYLYSKDKLGNKIVGQTKVLDAYWNRLSRKAVEYGAGVLWLFFKEVGEIRDELVVNMTDTSTDSIASVSVTTGDSVNDEDKYTRETTVMLVDARSIIERLNEVDPAEVLMIDSSDIEQVVGMRLIEQEKTDQKHPALKDTYQDNLPPEGSILPSAIGDFIFSRFVVRAATSSTIQNENNSVENISNASSSSDGIHPVVGSVVVSEVLFDAEGSDAGKEFIELYNMTDASLDMSGWSVQVGDRGKKNMEEGMTIAPHSYFVVWLGEHERADMVWKSGTLPNASGTVRLVASHDWFAESGAVVVDEFSYDVAALPLFEAGLSVGRVADNRTVFVLDAQTLWDRNIARAGESSTSNFITGVTSHFDENSGLTTIRVTYSRYPIIIGNTDMWKIIVFYKDGPPREESVIDIFSDFAPVDRNRVLSVRYDNCSGYRPIRYSVILPDTNDPHRCGIGGGIANRGLWPKEDGWFEFTTTDQFEYLTFAVYDFLSSGAGNQVFSLAMTDSREWR